MRIPPREGYLFDPDRYLFLEGRHSRRDRPAIPRVSDGVIYRVLGKLMLLDGERLSYRTLAVEQIGSVYERLNSVLLDTSRPAADRLTTVRSLARLYAREFLNRPDGED
jgi:hypothetical protein